MDDEAGKGDDPRPTDKTKFDSNYDRLFGSPEDVAERRRKWIEDKKRQEAKSKQVIEFSPIGHPDPIKLLERQVFSQMVKGEINEYPDS